MDMLVAVEKIWRVPAMRFEGIELRAGFGANFGQRQGLGSRGRHQRRDGGKIPGCCQQRHGRQRLAQRQVEMQPDISIRT